MPGETDHDRGIWHGGRPVQRQPAGDPGGGEGGSGAGNLLPGRGAERGGHGRVRPGAGNQETGSQGVFGVCDGLWEPGVWDVPLSSGSAGLYREREQGEDGGGAQAEPFCDYPADAGGAGRAQGVLFREGDGCGEACANGWDSVFRGHGAHSSDRFTWDERLVWLYRKPAGAGGAAGEQVSPDPQGLSGECGSDCGAGFEGAGDTDEERGEMPVFQECEGGFVGEDVIYRHVQKNFLPLWKVRFTGRIFFRKKSFWVFHLQESVIFFLDQLFIMYTDCIQKSINVRGYDRFIGNGWVCVTDIIFGKRHCHIGIQYGF